MRRGRLLARALLVCALLGAAAASAEPVRLEAERLELQPPGALHAEGDVRLRIGECELSADELSLTGSLIVAGHAWLRTGAIELRAPRLSWTPGGGLEARWPRLALCGCGGQSAAGRREAPKGPLLRIGADRARIAPGGARVHLRWPALWIGSRRVLAVPYLALPLRRGVSGLLLPQLGYSGRDGVRVEQAGYLAGERADLLLGLGYIQSRGAWGRLRGSLIWDGHGEAELSLRGLQDGDRWRGALAGAAWLAWRGLGAGVVADLVSDPAWPAELDRDPDRVFSPYLRSRGWASAAAGPFAASGTLDVYQDLGAPLRQPEPLRLGWGRLAADLLPVSLIGPLLLEAQAQLQGRPTTDSQAFASPLRLPGLRASFGFNPRLALASAAGPLRISSQLGYRALVGWLDGSSASADQHGLLASLEASVPLARRYGAGRSVQHRVEPFAAALYARSWGALELPGVARQQGAFAALGLRSSLLGRAGQAAPASRIARGELRLELPIDEPGAVLRGAPVLQGELELRLPRLVSLDGLWRGRPGSGETVELRGQLCVPGRRGHWRACSGYLRLRQLRAEDLLGGEALGWPLLDPQTQLALQTALDQVFASAEVHGGPLTVWGRAAVDPLAGRLTQGSYGLRLELRCRCVRVEVLGVSRAGQRWPDWLAQLSLSPAALGSVGCGAAANLEGLSAL
jgi:hypothetical protein